MKEKRVQKVQKKSSEKKLGEDVFERKKSSESSEKKVHKVQKTSSEKMYLKGKKVQKVPKNVQRRCF